MAVAAAPSSSASSGTGAQQQQQEGLPSNPHVIVDEFARVWPLLAPPREGGAAGRVDIVLDNAGLELFGDLLLADFLVTQGLASQVRGQGAWGHSHACGDAREEAWEAKRGSDGWWARCRARVPLLLLLGSRWCCMASPCRGLCRTRCDLTWTSWWSSGAAPAAPCPTACCRQRAGTRRRRNGRGRQSGSWGPGGARTSRRVGGQGAAWALGCAAGGLRMSASCPKPSLCRPAPLPAQAPGSGAPTGSGSRRCPFATCSTRRLACMPTWRRAASSSSRETSTTGAGTLEMVLPAVTARSHW